MCEETRSVFKAGSEQLLFLNTDETENDFVSLIPDSVTEMSLKNKCWQKSHIFIHTFFIDHFIFV